MSFWTSCWGGCSIWEYFIDLLIWSCHLVKIPNFREMEGWLWGKYKPTFFSHVPQETGDGTQLEPFSNPRKNCTKPSEICDYLPKPRINSCSSCIYAYLQHRLISPSVQKLHCRQRTVCYYETEGRQLLVLILLPWIGKENWFYFCLLSSELETWKWLRSGTTELMEIEPSWQCGMMLPCGKHTI